MKQLPDGHFQAVLTDPPYGTTALAFDQIKIDWPAWWAEIHRVTQANAVIVCFAADLFTVDLIQSNRQHYRYRLVWEKTMTTGFLDANLRPLRAHEDILIFARSFKASTYNPQKEAGEPHGKSSNRTALHYAKQVDQQRISDGQQRFPRSVLRFQNGLGRGNGNHPTQKPLDLMTWLVRTYTNPGDRVLDPFMGGGTTGAACIQEGRAFVGIELDPAYHAMALRRIQNAQPALVSS